MSTFFLVLILLFFGGDLLWWQRIRRRIRRQPWRGLAAGFVALQMAALAVVLFGRFGGHNWDAILPRPLLSLIFIWHLTILIPWLLIVGVGELSKGTLAFARWFARGQRRPVPSDGGMSRREFLSSTIAFAPAVLSVTGAIASEPQLESFIVQRRELHLPTLPPQLDGVTIAHVSDIHIGRFTGDRVLAKISDQVNALNADLVLMTGDLINFALQDLPAGLELMKSLRSAHGTYLCEGNHDLFENADYFRRTVLQSGLALLRNQQVTLPIKGVRLQLLGLPWAHGDEETEAMMQRLNRDADENAFRILLAHHPHAFDHAQNFPLTLSGHTHGGQLNLTQEVGFGRLFFRYWSGLYWKDDRALVVSNGVGNWFPLRINAPAEITHLTLRKGDRI